MTKPKSKTASAGKRTAPPGAEHDTAEPQPEEAAETSEAGSEKTEETEASAGAGEAAATEAAAPEPSPEVQIADLKDQLLRALAETENVRRRAARERDETAKYAITGFARDILTMADNLRRTIDSGRGARAGETGPEAIEALLSGAEVTERDLLATLERHGIRPITPLGEKFNHNFHQAMYEAPNSELEPGTVIEVVQTGHTIAGRLLRPALVGVSKTPDAPEPKPAGTEDKPGSNVDSKA